MLLEEVRDSKPFGKVTGVVDLYPVVVKV